LEILKDDRMQVKIDMVQDSDDNAGRAIRAGSWPVTKKCKADSLM